MERTWMTIDGNEAAASVAHRLSEIIAIYPITPSTPMGELADSWSAGGQTNIWATVPTVVEMQSEGGAGGGENRGAGSFGAAISVGVGESEEARRYHCYEQSYL